MPESVQFFTSGGLKLAGDLYAPQEDSGDKCRAVILCQVPSRMKVDTYSH